MAVETVACFTRQSAMESSVVSSLPDRAFTPTLASTVWNDQLCNTLARLLESPLVGVILLIAHHQLSYLRENWTLMECGARLGRTFLRDADPHKSFGENLLVYHPWKVEQS